MTACATSGLLMDLFDIVRGSGQRFGCTTSVWQTIELHPRFDHIEKQT